MALLLIYLMILVALERSCVNTMSEDRPQIVKARLGEDVKFTCAPEVNETLIYVKWKKLNSDKTTERRMSNKGGHLVIENLQIADAGLYECEALFGGEIVYPMRSQNFSLEVEVSTCTLRSYHESNYGNLTSNCSSNGTVRYHTKCSFNCDDSSILLGRSLLTCGTNDTFDFPLPTCRGMNLYAVVYPRVADVGENVDMPCGSDLGEEEYNLYWYKYGTSKTLLLQKTSAGEQTTPGDRGYEIKNGTDLFIPNATKGDSGLYRCEVFSHGSYLRYPYNCSLLVKATCKMPALNGALHTTTTTCRSEATIVEETSCHYYCQSNYKLVGQGVTKCLENGSLSEHVPSCKATCKMPALNGALHTTTTTCRSEAIIVEETSCHYYCQSNYTLVGQGVTKCLENGSLSEHVPSCKGELEGGRTRSKWWIAVLPIVGAISAFSIYKLRKWKTGGYSGVSRADGEAGPQPPVLDQIHLDTPVTSHARSHHQGNGIDGQSHDGSLTSLHVP